MKVALVGPGELAQHLIPPLLAANHTLLVLTRSPKPWLATLSPSTPQLIIPNYTDTALLTTHLNTHAVDVLISTLSVFDDTNVAIHLALLAACQASKTCKRFIPSEYSGNILDFPDQPIFTTTTHAPTRAALRSQSEVEYTLFCNGWFLEYLLPPGHPKRIFRDIGHAWVLDHTTKRMSVYGSGRQEVNFVSASDAGTALAKLLDAPKGEWEDITFVRGEQVSWNEVFEKLKVRDGGWEKEKVSLAQSIQRIVVAGEKGDEWERAVGMFEVHGHSGATEFPGEEVERQRGKFFGEMRWVGVEDVLGLA